MIGRDNEYCVFDFVLGISEALDLISPEINDHHKRVAYIAHAIAQHMELPDPEIRDIVIAAILHDIGAFSLQERLCLQGLASIEAFDLYRHAHIGYMLMRSFEPLSASALMVRHHHCDYDPARADIPRGSHILRLADSVAIAIDDDVDVLDQVARIVDEVTRGAFMPEAVQALLFLSRREYFWVETCSLSVAGLLRDRLHMEKRLLGIPMLASFSKVIAQIIDFRSRFTATHSSGVAAVAQLLARLFEFSPRECQLMEIAGHLHDLGKLTVSNEILEKPGALDSGEINVMRKHTYYTQLVLGRIRGLEDVAMWAAYHHERLDGNGYPFHVMGDDFTKLSRIMAVADIFTAITEDRPYRSGMDSVQAMRVLENMAGSAIDPGVVRMVVANYDEINTVRAEAQSKAKAEYEQFMRTVVTTMNER